MLSAMGMAPVADCTQSANSVQGTVVGAAFLSSARLSYRKGRLGWDELVVLRCKP
jgi:hypothetical protein